AVDTATVLLDALTSAFPQFVERPLASRECDHRHVERARLHHALQRGEDLLGCQVTRRAVEDQRTGTLVAHGTSLRRVRRGRRPLPRPLTAPACRFTLLLSYATRRL